MRQEASRLGGIGSCGRELCCSTWLTDFKTVSTSAARYQNLSLNTLKLAGQCGKLKCCLNYELDTYMDALKYIPDNVNTLRTEKGDARLQKTDIFKKLMWFSYPREESWVPITITRVKEIQQMNKEGLLPADLGEIIEIETKPVKVLDYENVVGQDSLTRLDERTRNKKKSKNRNKNKNQGFGESTQQRPELSTIQNPQAAREVMPRPAEGENCLAGISGFSTTGTGQTARTISAATGTGTTSKTNPNETPCTAFNGCDSPFNNVTCWLH